MTMPQIEILLLLLGLFVLFLSGKVRHDVAALGALIIAVIFGLVPATEAFYGLGHTATVTVAEVLVLTRVLTMTGATERVGDLIRRSARSTTAHVGTLSAITAAMSTCMNNVGALGLMMPVAMQTASALKRSPSLLLMPVSFAGLLGGLITLIGTPPNIIASSFRRQQEGAPFNMFDFSWVGLPVAIAGLAYLAFVGWRLIPSSRQRAAGSEEFFAIGDYVTEVRARPKNDLVGRTIGEIGDGFATLDVAILGMLRSDRRIPNVPRRFLLWEDDILIVEVAPDHLETFLKRFDLEIVGADLARKVALSSDDVRVMEAVVKPGSELDGRRDARDRLTHQFNVNLLAVAREGSQVRDRLDRIWLRGGDVLLLQGESVRLAEVSRLLGLLPLAVRKLQVSSQRAWPAILLFGLGVAVAALGLLPIHISFGAVIVALVVFGILPTREIYEDIDWSVIVLLAAMIPIGAALETSGLAATLASGLAMLAGETSTIFLLMTIFIITMSITDIINNAATVVIMAPIAINLANTIGVNVDSFLMA
ncbi:MAG: SLC13 family permease, partial [Pseudomonadota bacterium]